MADCHIIRNPKRPLGLKGPVFCVLGNLDGVHRGHQALVAEVLRARNAHGEGSTVAVTFYPHPESVVGPQAGVKVAQLTDLRRKVQLLGAQGIEYLVLFHFTKKFAQIRAQDFITDHLLTRLGVSHLVIGPDAHVGYRREGTPRVIQEYFRAAGKEAVIAPFFELHGERVSSGRVRGALQIGDVALIQQLLGRAYAVEGRVRHGDGRGKKIGVPTANINSKNTTLPRFGVYAGYLTARQTTGDAALRNAIRYSAVANIGVRPTFGGTTPTLEVHALDYQGGDFYGKRVSFEFVARIRDEQKFSGIDALTQQIHKDIASARQILGTQNGK